MNDFFDSITSCICRAGADRSSPFPSRNRLRRMPIATACFRNSTDPLVGRIFCSLKFIKNVSFVCFSFEIVSVSSATLNSSTVSSVRVEGRPCTYDDVDEEDIKELMNWLDDEALENSSGICDMFEDDLQSSFSYHEE